MSACVKYGETRSSGTSIRCWLKIVDTARSDPSYTTVDWAVSPIWLSASRPGRSRTRSHQAHMPIRPRQRAALAVTIANFLNRKGGSITESTPESQMATSKHQHDRRGGATEAQLRTTQHQACDRLV